MQFATGSSPLKTTYTTNVTVRCAPGYSFGDFSQSNVMTCTSWGKWSQVPNCMRKLTHLFIF